MALIENGESGLVTFSIDINMHEIIAAESSTSNMTNDANDTR
ncbi:hypothetical protein BTN50_0743 [Candidatus Enterovibrio altilux]|uniref:Uncharacterized protein n=1 Tax=Candidatus Enterovibrio altilux TaxID=1927128 RepID=A0A291B8F8_9GAMM|nr:hypothetical protein BTN50_0743 [Candidatus Enterovibrio luxaltus]